MGGGLLIANHLDESLWWANQKHWAVVRSYLLHSFLQVHSVAVPFSHFNLCNYSEPIPLSWAKRVYCNFSSSNCTVQVHILITAGDALIRNGSARTIFCIEKMFWNMLIKSWENFSSILGGPGALLWVKFLPQQRKHLPWTVPSSKNSITAIRFMQGLESDASDKILCTWHNIQDHLPTKI
jgi:hypothetical protein